MEIVLVTKAVLKNLSESYPCLTDDAAESYEGRGNTQMLVC